MNWITFEELLLIHEKVIEETGGLMGYVNVGSLETCLLRPFTTISNQEMFPEIWDKVGVLIHSIISFHPFIDGNKRTALVAADVCLRLNGLRLVPSEEVEPFFWSIARGERSVSDIIRWVERNAEKMKA